MHQLWSRHRQIIHRGSAAARQLRRKLLVQLNNPRFARAITLTATLMFLPALVLICVETNTPQPPAPVIIEWSTRRENKTAGYLLYRAENPTVLFSQLTPNLIPAANDPYLGGTYRYTDTTTMSGVTYYYQIEDVESDGTRTRHAPISITARASAPTFFGLTISWGSIFAGAMMVIGAWLIGISAWLARGK